MKYLTQSEYARLYRITKQAVADRIRRKTLPLVQVKVIVKRIPVEDTEFDRVKPKTLTG